MANVHVVIGADDFLVDEAARKVVGDGVGLEVVDSLDSGNAELQLRDLRAADASFSTPPFLDPRKVTWWRNVHFLPGGGRAAAEEVKSALERFAEKLASSPLPENQHFILSGPHLLKTSVFARRLSGVAEVVEFAAGKPWEAARAATARAVAWAAEMGLRFAPGAAELFVGRVGADARSLRSELDKMRAYLGGDAGEIAPADVDAISSPGAGVEPELWDVTDALGARDLGKCLAAVRRFEGEGGFAVLMTTVLEKFFRQLLDLARGRTEGMAPFAMRKNTGFLRNWRERELRVARWRFLALRERAVTSSGGVEALVVTEIVRTCRGL